MIELKNINKVYNIGNESLTALDDVNFSVREGEYTSIMGPSGSGKSTLMNVLGLLDTFDSGTFHLNGKDISNLSENEKAIIRNAELGFVFQSFNLMPRLNLLENVALPLIYSGVNKNSRKRRAKNALYQVGLENFMSHKPNEISGGQRQRVAIARAIINNPSFLLADEPTGNLDSKNTLDILKLFQDLNTNHGTTIIIVTHEAEVAQYTKRIVNFQDGHIINDYMVEDRQKL